MKLTQKHIGEISNAFSQLQTKRDLLSLFNKANILLHGEKADDFELKSLTYYSNPKIAGDRYNTFAVNKKSGGKRIIHAPVKGLKAIQKSLNLILQCVYSPHNAATGFIKDKSIVDNARKHVGKHYVFNTDLKDFFPSIDQARFWGRLKHPPFNLNEKNGNLEIANRIAALCGAELMVKRKKNGKWTEEMRYVLPQGAPTSPTISNIIAKNLDRKLTGVAKRFGCTYTRYADDLTFSSMHNIYKEGSDFREELKRVVNDQNFHINDSKTRLIEDVYHQEVTGLVVNERVNVNRRFVKELRMWLYYWEKYGYEHANKIFKKDYQEDKGHVKEGDPNFENVLHGKLQFMKMVKGATDGTYQKLYNRYKKLVTPDDETLTQIEFETRKSKKKSDKQVKNKLASYINPVGTVNLLGEYNKNIVLKSTSHKIDEDLLSDLVKEMDISEYDYEEHVKHIEREYRKLQYNKTVAPSLMAKMNEYLLNKKGIGWSEDNISVSWKSEALKRWAGKHPHECPNPDKDLDHNGYELEEVIPLKNGDMLGTFNEVISVFKNQTEFRDQNDLKNIVERKNIELAEKFGLDLASTFDTSNMKEGVRFYSDVEKVEQAYGKIIKMCVDYYEENSEHNEEPEFRIGLEEVNARDKLRIVFSIRHVNSTFGKTAQSFVDRYGASFTSLINKQINGICDLRLTAEFPNNEFATVLVWPRMKDAITKLEDDFVGVRFELIFYRSL